MFSKIILKKKKKSTRLPADFTVEKYLDALKAIESRFYLHGNMQKFYLLKDLTLFSDIEARKKQQ